MSNQEARLALKGLWAFARFDRKGIDFFDSGIAACVRSFWVYVAALPIFAFITSIELAHLKADADPILFFLARFLGYVISCLVFPLVAEPILRLLSRADRWPQLTAGYNWLAVTQYAGMASIILLGRLGLPESAVTLLSIALSVFALLVEGFMFEAILQTGFPSATALLLVDLVLGECIDTISRSFS